MPGNRTGRRRPNGEGGVYFEKASGLWRARYSLPNGKRPAVSARTQAACLAKLREAIRERDAGLPTQDQRQTVAEFMAYWLEHEAPNRCRPGTLVDYQSVNRVHIVPELGRLRLVALRPEHVQRWLNELTQAGKSPATVAKYLAVLKSALSRAEALGRVPRNVATLAQPPSLNAAPIDVPEPAEVRALLAAFGGHSLDHLVTTAAATGLRRAEALGLTWDDIELDRPDGARLQVRYQLQKIGGELRRVEPKTRNSRRTVHLSGLAITALQRQRAAQNRARLAAGAHWQDTGLVFTNDRGRGLDGENVYKRFLRHLRALGLPPMTWHVLRHCYASLQAAEGASLQEIMQDLGHTDVRTTLRYSHLFPDARRESAARIDRALGQQEA